MESSQDSYNNYEKVKRFLKYILLTLIICIGARYIPDLPLQNDEILIIGFSGGISFAIIDMISPSIEIKNLNN